MGQLAQQLGAGLGSVIGHARAGAALAQTVYDRINREKPVPVVGPASPGEVARLPRGESYAVDKSGTPVVGPATYGDIMGLPHRYPPTVHPASMTDVMSASLKGGIPVGRAVGGAGAGQVAGGASGTGGGAPAGGSMVGSVAMGNLAAAAVAMHVNQWTQGISKIASTPKNDIGGLATAASGLTFGPIGGKIVSAVVGEIVETMGDALRAPGVIAGRVGDVVGSAARGENAEAVGKTYSAFVDLARQTPLVGHALGLIGDSAGQVVGAFRDVTMGFVERGRELSGYSGDLATSYAQTDVKNLFADIREAQTLGPGLGRLNEAQNDLSLTLRDLLLPIKEWIIDKLANIAETINQDIKLGTLILDTLQMSLARDINQVISAIESSTNALLAVLPGSGGFQVHFGRVMVESLRKSKDDNDKDDALDGWLKAPSERPNMGARNGNPDFAAPPLNLPILKRF